MAARTVTVTVPWGTNVTALVPAIAVSEGAVISPASGTQQDFTSPVTYTVTAADGTTQDYTVTVTVAANPAKDITAFSFTTPAATGIITGTAIAVTVPYGTVVTSLTPTIIHTGASISPTGAQNFTSPVTYTVTAADGTTQDYTVTVTVAPDIWDGITFTAITEGDGSLGTPWLISTGAQLAWFAQMVNAGIPYAGEYFTLTGNLDLDDHEWTAIGRDAARFKGTFDGAGHVISKLVINKFNASYQGLFGYIDGAAIKNLGLEDVNVTGQSYVGGVAGWVENNGSIENCYSAGNVTGSNNTVGGVAGYLLSSIVSGCYSAGNVTGAGNVGGVVGGVSGSIENSYSTGNVTGTSTGVGGVVGSVDSGIIQNCYSTGNVSGTSVGVGGVAGQVASSGNVTNCAALNPAVMATIQAGRVAGITSVSLSGNAAWSGMNVTGDTVTDNSDKDGAGITAAQIQNGTGLPAALKTSPWAYTAGKLPVLSGFTGQTDTLPAHLQ
jgi:hypothetical protein